MKPFLIGMLGAVLAICVYGVARTQYDDYRARSEVYWWLGELQTLQRDIEATSMKHGKPTGVGGDYKMPALYPGKVRVIQVADNGEILVGGGSDGQLLILQPSLTPKGITWKCMGGPTRDMPAQCKFKAN